MAADTNLCELKEQVCRWKQGGSYLVYPPDARQADDLGALEFPKMRRRELLVHYIVLSIIIFRDLHSVNLTIARHISSHPEMLS